MNNKRDPVKYRDKNLEQRLTYVSAYLLVCMIPENHRVSVVFTAADLKYLCSVVGMVATLSKRLSLLPKAKNSKLAILAKNNSRKGLWRTYFTGKMLGCSNANVRSLMNFGMLRKSRLWR